MNEEKKNGRCPEGQYYCYTDEKCKPIPKGYKMVGRAGYLRKENGHSVDEPKNVMFLMVMVMAMVVMGMGVVMVDPTGDR